MKTGITLVKNHWALFFALGLILIQTSMAIYLGNQVFDEAITVYYTSQVSGQGFSILLEDLHMTLYNGLIYLWSNLFGLSLPSLKSFSVVVSGLTALYTYNLALHFISKRAAQYSVLILSLCGTFLAYSYQSRSYSLLILLSVISTYYLLRSVESGQKSDRLKYLISICLLPYSHIIGLLMTGVHFVYAFTVPSAFKERTFVFSSHLVAALVFSPIVFAIFSRYDYSKDVSVIYSWVNKPTLGTLVRSLVYISGTRLMLLALVFSVILVGIRVFKKLDNRAQLYFPLLFYWILFPSAFLFLYSYIHTPVFILRGVVSGVVPGSLLIAAALDTIPGSTFRNFIAATTLLVSQGLVSRGQALKAGFYYQFRMGSIAEKLFEKVERRDRLQIYYGAGLQYNIALSFAPECLSSSQIDECLSQRRMKPFRLEEFEGKEVALISYQGGRKELLQEIKDFQGFATKMKYQEKIFYTSPGGQVSLLLWGSP